MNYDLPAHSPPQADLSQMGGASKRSWDPYVAVKCEKTCKISKAVTNVSNIAMHCRESAVWQLC